MKPGIGVMVMAMSSGRIQPDRQIQAAHLARGIFL
jgi:hypothetical protein